MALLSRKIGWGLSWLRHSCIGRRRYGCPSITCCVSIRGVSRHNWWFCGRTCLSLGLKRRTRWCWCRHGHGRRRGSMSRLRRRDRWRLSTRVVSRSWTYIRWVLSDRRRHGSWWSSVGWWWSTHGHVSWSCRTCSGSWWCFTVRSLRVGSRKPRWWRSVGGPWRWWSCIRSWPGTDESRRSVHRADPRVRIRSLSFHTEPFLSHRSPRLPSTVDVSFGRVSRPRSAISSLPRSKGTSAFSLFLPEDERHGQRQAQVRDGTTRRCGWEPLSLVQHHGGRDRGRTCA